MWWQNGRPGAPLRWAASIYGRINTWNLNRRGKQAVAPAIPLISVGNITVGGSGKTPFIIWLCAELRARGMRPAVLCRGDGGSLRHPRLVHPGDEAAIVGDEALLLARRCRVPVISGHDRVAACRMAESMPDAPDVLLLDDGFQYRQLLRACDVVLVPAVGVGNGHLLPAGPLREPVSALKRADIIVRTGCGPAVPFSDGKEWRWQTRVRALEPASRHAISDDSGVVAVAGIARPRRMLASLKRLGLRVETFITFPDHHCYSPRDVERLAAMHLPVVTTEKDAVKLEPLWPPDPPLWVLALEGIGEEGLPEAVIGTILAHSTA
jgi:tetraacyldisaccharide 4''-kinase